MFYRVLCFSLAFRLCFSVPASPTDSLIDDVNNIKVSLKYLAGDVTPKYQKSQYKITKGILDKWNTMYNGQIEPRMVSASNILASVDSNVRNLQERAHVWDTFQLHISAWNDQLSSTDRKLDIISKAQEKLFNMDTKLNYIANLEYKLENVLKKLEDTGDSINAISKKLDDKRQGDSLFGEFATRGILSTLKMIEKKLDKVHLTGQNLMLKQSKNEDNRNRLVKCNNNSPPVLEEILHDVSSKVDVIFDKISEKDEQLENDSADYFEDQQIGSGDASDEIRSDSDIRLLRKLLKRANHPCKQTNKALDVIMMKVNEIENNTAVIIKKNGKNCKMHALDIERMLSNITQINSNLQAGVYSYFTEQETRLNSMIRSNCLSKQLDTSVTLEPEVKAEMEIATPSVPVISQEEQYPIVNGVTHKSAQIITKPYEVEYAENITSCENLPIDAKSGVYNFTDVADFNIRYCHEHWTIIQRRDNYDDLQNFSLSWSSYKYGFGDVTEDFWIGNEFLHKMSNRRDLLLRVELEDFDGNRAWAEYDFFKVASERENYKLFVSGYSGNASDSLSSHSNSSFSTYDRKNDAAPSCCPCSVSYGGGWWFNSCFEANLNGVYHRNPNTNEYYRGIIWEHWLGNYSLKKTVLMVKPRVQHLSDDKTEENVTFSTYYPLIEDP